VWIDAVTDRRSSLPGRVEIDWVRLYCEVDGKEVLVAGDDIVGGGFFLRNPWFGEDDYQEPLGLPDITDEEGRLAFDPRDRADRVWHLWNGRTPIPSDATRCWGEVRVLLSGSSIFSAGIDYWINQTAEWCCWNQCNTEASASDFYGPTDGWITVQIGRQTTYDN
jgi:hypothetical protein